MAACSLLLFAVQAADNARAQPDQARPASPAYSWVARSRDHRFELTREAYDGTWKQETTYRLSDDRAIKWEGKHPFLSDVAVDDSGWTGCTANGASGPDNKRTKLLMAIDPEGQAMEFHALPLEPPSRRITHASSLPQVEFAYIDSTRQIASYLVFYGSDRTQWLVYSLSTRKAITVTPMVLEGVPHGRVFDVNDVRAIPSTSFVIMHGTVGSIMGLGEEGEFGAYFAVFDEGLQQVWSLYEPNDYIPLPLFVRDRQIEDNRQAFQEHPAIRTGETSRAFEIRLHRRRESRSYSVDELGSVKEVERVKLPEVLADPF